MDKQVELLPCPFCNAKAYKSEFGSDTHRRPSDNAHLFVIKCGMCCAEIRRFGDKLAIAAWNQRTTPTPPAGQFDTSKYIKLSWNQQEEIKTGKFTVRKQNLPAGQVEAVARALAAADPLSGFAICHEGKEAWHYKIKQAEAAITKILEVI
jgi:hypothetical protein